MEWMDRPEEDEWQLEEVFQRRCCWLSRNNLLPIIVESAAGEARSRKVSNVEDFRASHVYIVARILDGFPAIEPRMAKAAIT